MAKGHVSYKNAFPCPGCKNPNTKIPDSWLFASGYLMRKRSCPNCHLIFGTVEYEASPEHDAPRLAVIEGGPTTPPQLVPQPVVGEVDVVSRAMKREELSLEMFGKKFNYCYSDEQEKVMLAVAAFFET